MRHVGPIAARELRSFFATPIGYALFTGYAAIGGFLFFMTLQGFMNEVQAAQIRQELQVLQLLNLNTHVIAPSIGVYSVLFSLLLMPVLTMRVFAEERANGTIELLLTSPVTAGELVLGKYLAVVAVVAILVGLTSLYPALLFVFGDPELWQTLAGLFALFGLGCALGAIGCFFSALTRSQIIAALLTFITGLALMLSGSLANQLEQGSAPDWIAAAVRYVGTADHFGNSATGALETPDLLYWVIVSVLFLFFARAAVDSLRWR